MAGRRSAFSVLGGFWQEAGLGYVLAASPERRAELLGRGAPAPTPPVQAPAATSKTPVQDQTQVQTPTAPTDAFPPLPIMGSSAQWPPAWQALLQRRTQPRHPKTVWTYTGLDLDLLEQPDPLRKKMVARLIKDLGHPVGTHVFWPYQLPNDQERPESMFWSWERIFRPRALLVFGDLAARALELPRQFVLYSSHYYHGLLCIRLPEADLLARDQSMYARMLALLRGQLAFCQALNEPGAAS